MASRARANAQTPSVTMLEFLGPEVLSSQNIDWPIRIDELHNRMNVLEADEKGGDLKPLLLLLLLFNGLVDAKAS